MTLITPGDTAGLAPNAAPVPESLIFDTTAADFERDVIMRSVKVPVLVDFWATWCEPCKQLTPMLEKLVAEYHGAFMLAKVDVDKEQQLAAAVGIRSVPTLMLVKQGQLVDGFPGALPEAKLREFLGKHGIVPRAAPEDDTAAPEETPQAAATRLRAEIAASPDNDELKLDLALALTRLGETDEPLRLLDALPANLGTDDRARKARARLAFAALVATAPDLATLEARVASNPDDAQARHLLGVRLILAAHPQAGLDQLIELLSRDRSYADGLPRKALIDAFLILEDAELVSRYRRKMASLLF
ncbi:MAG: thioredoxin [Xanthomonadaceae bacterium]|nr:thioredoxin [Xanthomonadaceae bacterium]MDP2184174.1 thioredoxin [Xanthomonadales bacterium]MDZ4114720.1 thioredoxin [Xanthomonadaceae bacterium]